MACEKFQQMEAGVEIGPSLLVWYSRKEQNSRVFCGKELSCQRFKDTFLSSLVGWARAPLGLECSSLVGFIDGFGYGAYGPCIFGLGTDDKQYE